MVPPPERSARKIVRTASGEIECLSETRDIRLSSFSGILFLQWSHQGPNAKAKGAFRSLAYRVQMAEPFVQAPVFRFSTKEEQLWLRRREKQVPLSAVIR